MASFSRRKMISVWLRGSGSRPRWTSSWKRERLRWPCPDSEGRRLDQQFLLFEERTEGLHLYIGEGCRQGRVPGGKVQVVDPIHSRDEALVNGPLVRKADLDDFQLLQIQLCFRQGNQDSLESTLPIDAIQHALMGPHLDYPLSRRDLHRHVELQLARTEVKDEVGGQSGTLILDGQHFNPVSRLNSERQRQQMSHEQFEVSAGRLLVLIGGHVIEGAKGHRERVQEAVALVRGEPVHRWIRRQFLQ